MHQMSISCKLSSGFIHQIFYQRDARMLLGTHLVLSGCGDGGRVEHLLEVVLLVHGGVLVQAAVVRRSQHRLQHVLWIKL